MSTADKLNALIQTKANIKQALIDKGVEVNDVFSTYAEAITNLSTGSGGSSGGIFDFAAIGYTGNEDPMKSGVEYAKEIVNSWDSSITNLSSKYTSGTNVPYFPLVDTSKVVSTLGMFLNNTTLTIIPALDMSNNVDMRQMFEGCTSLVNVYLKNTNKNQSAYNMFNNCRSLTYIDNIDCSSCASAQQMFYYCLRLTYNPCINTYNITNMQRMFSYINSDKYSPISFDLRQLDTTRCTNMSYMFSSSRINYLLNVPADFGSAVTNMEYMFDSCQYMLEIPPINSVNATGMSGMFVNCSALKRINSLSVKQCAGSDLFSYSTITTLRYMLIKDLGTRENSNGWNFTKSAGWGVIDTDNPDARQSLIDSLITYSFDRATAGYSPITITLSTNTKALLTEDEIAQITAKGFTIA